MADPTWISTASDEELDLQPWQLEVKHPNSFSRVELEQMLRDKLARRAIYSGRSA